MSNNTRTWAEAVGLTGARVGTEFAPGSELNRIGFLLNSAARTIYDESRWWERFLVVEERAVVDGYVPYEQKDSCIVSGAGTSEANGEYLRNGNGPDGKPKYTNSIGIDIYSLFNSVWSIGGDSVYYENTSSSDTPPLDGWIANGGEEPAPIVQALSDKPTIGEYIGHWDGELWTCADSSRGQAYPDHNGIKIANCNHGDTVWVAYKKSLTDTFGDGEAGTISDVPAEWLEFMSYDAARAYLASQGSQGGYNPIAIRDVELALERALMKVSRQGINETIALYFRTNYGYDVSVK